MSTIALDAINCTMANLENVSTHVRTTVPSVNKMSMLRITLPWNRSCRSRLRPLLAEIFLEKNSL